MYCFFTFPCCSKFVANMDAQKNILMMIFHATKQDIVTGKFDSLKLQLLLKLTT